jgi:Host cell surface-exposed lipoprotein
MAFSRTGLIKQLKYEGFSISDATYAVDAVSPNWNLQAAKAAQSYLDSMAFSRSGLIEQLEYEGYTAQQAVYGVNQTGL